MRDLAILVIHLIATAARLLLPGGARSIISESLLLKHQLLILNRSRARAPNLQPIDRVIATLCAGLMHPARLLRSAIVLRPSTLMAFHRALVKRKYRLLFSPRQRRTPGPRGPSSELTSAIIELKRRNPRFGCRRIAQQPGVVDGPAVCRLFNQVIAGTPTLPHHLSSDHDPLFEFYCWKANLRILDVSEVKTLPHVPLSHPFVEQLIGTIRRELLDHAPFWGARDLERKLRHFRDYYNLDRVHASLDGLTPICKSASTNGHVISLKDYRWQSHCHGLYQLPAAA